ncbi:MAG: pyridoxal phosphate-dependent aminotransferase family protein [Phycisphaerales bacterium]
MPDTKTLDTRESPLAPAFGGFDATSGVIDGRRVTVFAGCNYLGLSHHPPVVGAVRDALAGFGLSASASRCTSGNTRPHEQLERDLARYVGREAGLLTPDGYIANLAAAQALAEDHAVALLDERAHLSLRDAARCAGLEVRTYRHLDAVDAGVQAAQLAPRGVVVMTDGVFAADGSITPLDRLLAALPPRGARLLVDDCHAFCVLGDHGRGSLSHFGIDDPRVVLTTTLAKGLGCAGGVIAGDASFVSRARRASAFVCTTPTPPALVEGARVALDVLGHDTLRFERLARSIRLVRGALDACGLRPHDAPVPVFAIDLGSAARRVAASLLDAGFFVPLVAYPGGPSREYLRLSVSSEHTPEQIDRLAGALDASLGGMANAQPA